MANIIVPHIKQSQETSCGAAALSMAYQYLGKSAQTEKIIWNRLKIARPNRVNEHYLKSFDMARDGQTQGFSYFIGQSILESSNLALQPIREFLSLSIPVIVCQKISTTNELGHFRVVTNIFKNNVILNDPMNERGQTTMDINEFVNLWKKSNNGEVIGGQFFTVFKKAQVKKKNTFTVLTFESSIGYFNATNLKFK